MITPVVGAKISPPVPEAAKVFLNKFASMWVGGGWRGMELKPIKNP